jgi:hypothetical protein
VRDSVEVNLGKGAVYPALVVGVIGSVVATFIKGKSGLIAGGFALFIVFIFFIIHLIISKISNNLDPIAVMGLALFSYFSKVLVLGVFLLVVVNRISLENLDRPSFGAIAIAVTVAWLGGEVRAFLKLKLHMPLPKKEK